MSEQIQVNPSKNHLCQFTILFHNHKPIIKTPNQAGNNKFVPIMTNFQQVQYASLKYQVNVFHSNQQKQHLNSLSSPTNNFSLPQKIIQYQVMYSKAQVLNSQDDSLQNQVQNISLSHSFIEELVCLSQQQNSGAVQKKKKQIQYLDIEQTQSMQQEDSKYFEEQHSEVVELTQEEKNFFNNFIINNQSPLEEDSPLRNIGHYQQISVQMKSNRIFHDKRRLIRNFFRPKGSFLKDDRTSCNSYTNFDQIYDSSKKSQGGVKGNHQVVGN